MTEPPSDKRIVGRFDGWTLLRNPLELLRAGNRVALQELPLRILETLLSRPGLLVKRDELIGRLWPEGVVEFDAGLNTAMRKLRVVLGDDAETPRYIETVPRQGYRFVGTLEPEASLGSVVTRAARPRWFALGVLALVIALGVAAVFLARSPLRELAHDAVATHHQYRIAVLPFENLSPDPANAFFADGMHEEVLSTLTSRAPDLEVISRTTMVSYRNRSRTMPELVRDLGATHVLEGSVRRNGEHVRITVALSEANTDRQLWAESFDSDLNKAMLLQSQVASEVVRRLTLRFAASPARLPPSPNFEAYDLWLKGVLAWQNVGLGASGPSAQDVEVVEGMFSRAIELDPGYAAAYADRARVRTAVGLTSRDFEAARADLAKARSIAGEAPHILVREATIAALVDSDAPRALQLIQRAEAIAPLSADFLMSKANFMRGAGQIEDSLAVHARALRTDPENMTILRFYVVNLFAAHRLRDAMGLLGKYDKRFPGRMQHGELSFAHTGSTLLWREEVNSMRAKGESVPLSSESALLRYEGQLAALDELLASTREPTFRNRGAYGPLQGAGAAPIAELRGWHRLLVRDAAISREAAELRDFVAASEQTKWNGWWLRLLAAEAALFTGDKARAAAEARAALVLIDRIPLLPVQLYGRSSAARILAWSDAQDEAIRLLEQLSGDVFNIGPAAITRDPLLSIPLEHNPRYKSLAKGLETEIATTASPLR